MAPYFQRNLVWRDLHKKDFIETILLGLPFPQIFIAQGDIDIETLKSTSCIVDGQQRMNAIKQFVDGEFHVSGRKFADLTSDEREEFLRYQVPVIDLDIKASDPQIIDIFTRLNRTFYALSAIEKMSTEYATVDLMLICKYLCGVLQTNPTDDGQPLPLGTHPMMPPDFLDWAGRFEVEDFQGWLLRSDIFSPFEISRLVHLMYTLNIVSTIYSGIFTRNDKTKEYLDQGQEYFEKRDEIMIRINNAARIIQSWSIPSNSMWHSKSNAFSLFIVVFWNDTVLSRLDGGKAASALKAFEAQVPEEYALAAREGVNNRRERLLRHRHICDVLGVEKNEKPLAREPELGI
jgi:hypothetical protein